MTIERATAAVLEHAARGDRLSSAALTFLVRRYRAGAQPDVSDVLGRALAAALAQHVDDRSTLERADWLRAFTEALSVSEDERLVHAARALIALLSGAWPSAAAVAEAAASVDACLFASHLVDPHDLVPRAIDELERIVAAAYRPGHGIGNPSDAVRGASALLTAFELTARLPYPMLAEELMQGVVHEVHADFVDSCEAVRVLCRLAALHDDAAYRAAAVIKPGTDYRAEAERVLTHASTRLDDPRVDAARYGLALDECSRSS